MISVAMIIDCFDMSMLNICLYLLCKIHKREDPRTAAPTKSRGKVAAQDVRRGKLYDAPKKAAEARSALRTCNCDVMYNCEVTNNYDVINDYDVMENYDVIEIMQNLIYNVTPVIVDL